VRAAGDADEGATLLFWQMELTVHVYQLNEDGGNKPPTLFPIH